MVIHQQFIRMIYQVDDSTIFKHSFNLSFKKTMKPDFRFRCRKLRQENKKQKKQVKTSLE